jgi:uncharacterized protein (DUF736 family)
VGLLLTHYARPHTKLLTVLAAPYLWLKLDDPSFNAPIYASLFDDDDGKTFDLVWTRPPSTNCG